MATAINLIIQTFEGSTCLGVASRSLPSQQLLKQMFPEPYNLCNSTSLENLNITIRQPQQRNVANNSTYSTKIEEYLENVYQSWNDMPAFGNVVANADACFQSQHFQHCCAFRRRVGTFVDMLFCSLQYVDPQKVLFPIKCFVL